MNNYQNWDQHKSKASWYIEVYVAVCVNGPFIFLKVKVDDDNKFKFKDASFLSRNLILHKGDLNLRDYTWQFGKTPHYSDKHLHQKFHVEEPEVDAKDNMTARQPDIALHPKNKDCKMPSVQDSAMISLRPSTRLCSRIGLRYDQPYTKDKIGLSKTCCAKE